MTSPSPMTPERSLDASLRQQWLARAHARALASGKPAQAQLLFELGLRYFSAPNGFQDGMTPLSFAAGEGMEPHARALLDHGADPNEGHFFLSPNPHSIDQDPPSSLFQPLSQAAAEGHLALVYLLLERGALPDGAPDQIPPLFLAAQYDQTQTLQALLHAGASPNRMDPLTGRSALGAAVSQLSLRSARILLSSGADAQRCSIHDHSALHLLAELPSDHLPDSARIAHLAQLLIDQGCSLDSPDDEGLTPLMSSIEHHHFSLALLLARRGADPSPVSHDGQTALHFLASLDSAQLPTAQSQQYSSLLSLLLEDARLDVNACDSFGRSPLLLAISQGNILMSRFLFVAGADPELADHQNHIPSSIAQRLHPKFHAWMGGPGLAQREALLLEKSASASSERSTPRSL